MQGYSKTKCVTYDYLSHGLDRLKNYETYLPIFDLYGISFSSNGYFLVEMIAKSIIECLGNVYHFERADCFYTDYFDEKGCLEERITTNINGTTLRINPTRSF